MNDAEIWKPVPVEIAPFYEVSDFGRVRSLDHFVPSRWPTYMIPVRGRILSQKTDKDGYRSVCLCDCGSEKEAKVHRLVGFAFLDNPLNKPEINHIDGNPANNRVGNLEWMTQAENLIHARMVLKRHKVGVDVCTAKLTENDVLDIRFLATMGAKNRALSNAFGVTWEMIDAVIKRTSWKHI